MSKKTPKFSRSLAIAPSTRGFGYAILEGDTTLVDWGVKTVKADKNARTIAKVRQLVTKYEPTVIVIQDYAAKPCRRSDRIRALGAAIIALASECGLPIVLLSHQQIRKVFFGDGDGTKHEIAKILAARLPEELASRLPPSVNSGWSQDYRMDIFDAVGLAVALRMQRPKRMP